MITLTHKRRPMLHQSLSLQMDTCNLVVIFSAGVFCPSFVFSGPFLRRVCRAILHCSSFSLRLCTLFSLRSCNFFGWAVVGHWFQISLGCSESSAEYSKRRFINDSKD